MRGFAGLLLLCASTAAAAPRPLDVLESACARCHNPANRKGGLDLTTREALLRGGDEGATVLLGDPAGSLLLRLVRHDDEPAMPRKAPKLEDAAIEALRRWIAAGVPYDRTLAAPKEERHWAFAPLQTFPPGTTIDSLVREALAARGMRLNPPAPPRVLVRRAWLDVVGLPPPPDALRAFLADRRPDAWQRLVDGLLADPGHGERWARHWLDVARYADSAGYEGDRDRPHAYAYRDFVIRALNDDMPFDRFVAWQLAGDELAPGTPDAWAATGFLAVGPASPPNPTDTKANKEKYRYDELDDLVSTTGAAFLGLTVGCARCHDHKYDPIPTRDYYRLVAAFATTERGDVALSRPVRDWERWWKRARAAHRERLMQSLAIPEDDRELLRLPLNGNNPTQSRVYKTWDARLKFQDEALWSALPPDARAEGRALEQAALAASEGERHLGRALAVTDDAPTAAPAFLLARGEPSRKVEPIDFGFLGALTAARSPGDYRDAVLRTLDDAPRTTLRRAALARWITDVEGGAGPLAARVAANRIWMHHFGRPLVETPNDLGTQTDPPPLAALLDFLAAELVRGGWRLKPLHRAILGSATWRQSAAFDAAHARPGAEKLPVRWRPARLEAEALRDTMLAAAGVLDRKMFGPPIKPAIPADATATRSSDRYPTDTPDGPPVWRRSVYVYAKRSVRYPFFEVLDAPDATASCGRRSSTTVPTQALAFLNDPFVRARAADFARRLVREAGPRRERQIERAFLIAFAREPDRAERAETARFLAARTAARSTTADAQLAALTDFCHALLTTNELAHVE